MQHLDFFTLNNAAGYEAWNDTFAYWVSTLNQVQAYKPEAEETWALMSFQYDVEEQAQDAEMLIGEPALIPAVFVPIAPVTLALKWSPFPAAVEALGQPVYFDTSRGNTVFIFAPTIEPKATGSTPDAKHFDFLLEHACSRAIQVGGLILLVGSPGWSYDHEDLLKEAPEIQKMMRDFGFVSTLRKPLTA